MTTRRKMEAGLGAAMQEHEPGTSGDHYDQHLWIWAHNPAGILATWNASVSC